MVEILPHTVLHFIACNRRGELNMRGGLAVGYRGVDERFHRFDRLRDELNEVAI